MYTYFKDHMHESLWLCEQLKNIIYVNSLDLLGIVLPVILEKLKSIIVHHQFQGELLHKESQIVVVIGRIRAVQFSRFGDNRISYS